MKIETKAVHAGDRKKPAVAIPVSTPIYASSTSLYESTAHLARVMGREEEGYSYARYENPTSVALEELKTALENGHGALACSSGMNAIHTALLGALLDRRKSIVASNALIENPGQQTDAGSIQRVRGHNRFARSRPQSHCSTVANR